jgi:dipeptidyl aminopeptidase/acylaminoacyl peptidase
MPTIAPYGSWKSPISSDLVVAGNIRLGQPYTDGGTCYWLEGRPLDGGRTVVVCRTADGRMADRTPAGYYVRTLVHEYGGGAYLVANGTIYFSNYADQRVYVQPPDAEPYPLTAAGPLRYADYMLDAPRNRLIAICEDHGGAGEAANYLAAIDLATGDITPLHQGRTFYAHPRLSPDGNQLVWLAWDHPHMPWEAAELLLAPIAPDGTLGAPTIIAGGAGDVAFQPEWSPDGSLFFVAERSGWWNLYHWQAGVTTAICPMEAEFGQPLWQFGTTTYAVLAADRLLVTYCVQGMWQMAMLQASDPLPNPLPEGEGTHSTDQASTWQHTVIDTPYSEFYRVQADAAANAAVVIAAGPTAAKAVLAVDLRTHTTQVVQQNSSSPIDPANTSLPEVIAFPTQQGRRAYGFFYPPKNAEYEAPAGALPPLLVMSHGGPTGATAALFDLEIQYWTSRGIAVLDVNYGGSTGYGREYRERLVEQWGIVDVGDCCNGALFLAQAGRVDGKRLAITGGSAGGYTTLAALAFRDVFQAGASHYGIGDLEAMTRDTHKFESRYLDSLIGAYPAERARYLERSPVHHVSSLECPVIFFQGLEDKVVPPNQAEDMVAALRAKGMPVAYVPFEGEQHGFRIAKNIKRALEGEFYFYSRVFGFTPADVIEPVEIENM